MKNMSPYKTAEQLGIEKWEHDGLVALIGPLSRDELEVDMQYPTPPGWFRGAGFSPTALCGTVHCIGGWLAFKKGMSTRPEIGAYVFRSEPDGTPLHELFFPEGRAFEFATAPQASRAIVNFLMTGNPSWDQVMQEPA